MAFRLTHRWWRPLPTRTRNGIQEHDRLHVAAAGEQARTGHPPSLLFRAEPLPVPEADRRPALEKLIPARLGIFGWVNRYLVIPTFNYLNGFNLNFGIIILILTILVRIILLLLTYGSFKSQAKIRVLQPEMLELNESTAMTR